MNAILIFDPANDLLFVKSNQLFRCKLAKYARLNGLLSRERATNSGAGGSRGSRPTRVRKRGPPASSFDKHFATSPLNADLSDTSRSYNDILMLLLTPYVASLRLNNDLHMLQVNNNSSKDNAGRGKQHSGDDIGVSSESMGFSTGTSQFSTINMPVECLKECQVVYCELYDFIFIYMQQLESVSSFKMRLLQKRCDLFARLTLLLFGQAFNSLKSNNNNINYSTTTNITHSSAKTNQCCNSCDLMIDSNYCSSSRSSTRSATTPSSSMDHNLNNNNDNYSTPTNCYNHQQPMPLRVEQSQILRDIYDCWFENQFEPELFLEANERLIVGSHIIKLCQATLEKISFELCKVPPPSQREGEEMAPTASDKDKNRASEAPKRTISDEELICRNLEAHQYALLFSNTKLVARFACPNSRPLTQEDLIMLLILLRTFNRDHCNELLEGDDSTTTTRHDSSASATGGDSCPCRQQRASQSSGFSSGGGGTPLGCCYYRSHYQTDRHTHQIYPNPTSTRGQRGRSSSSLDSQTGERLFGGTCRAAGPPCNCHRRRRDHRRCCCGRGCCCCNQSAATGPTTTRRLPNQFPIFLCSSINGAGGSSNNDNRFSKQSAAACDFSSNLKQNDKIYVPHMIRFVVLTKGITLILISEISSSYLNYHLSRAHKILLEFNRNSAAAFSEKFTNETHIGVGSGGQNDYVDFSACDDARGKRNRTAAAATATVSRSGAKRGATGAIGTETETTTGNLPTTRVRGTSSTGINNYSTDYQLKVKDYQIKLGQIARMNDCISSIRNYFYGPDLIELLGCDVDNDCDSQDGQDDSDEEEGDDDDEEDDDEEDDDFGCNADSHQRAKKVASAQKRRDHYDTCEAGDEKEAYIDKCKGSSVAPTTSTSSSSSSSSLLSNLFGKYFTPSDRGRLQQQRRRAQAARQTIEEGVCAADHLCHLCGAETAGDRAGERDSGRGSISNGQRPRPVLANRDEENDENEDEQRDYGDNLADKSDVARPKRRRTTNKSNSNSNTSIDGRPDKSHLLATAAACCQCAQGQMECKRPPWSAAASGGSLMSAPIGGGHPEGQRHYARHSHRVNRRRRRRRRKPMRMFDSLDADKQRLCRHLLRRLSEMAQNNVQTYVKQTFNITLDEHKREALLSAVCATVRDSFSAFILEPQLNRLNYPDRVGKNSTYLRHFSAQVDRIRLMAREELSDYLDYLAVKANCNVTLGAPLTHDMPAISSFIYIDRKRQELAVSPLAKSVQLSRRELIEGDFESAIERQRKRTASSLNGGGGKFSSYCEDDDDDDDNQDDDNLHPGRNLSVSGVDLFSDEEDFRRESGGLYESSADERGRDDDADELDDADRSGSSSSSESLDDDNDNATDQRKQQMQQQQQNGGQSPLEVTVENNVQSAQDAPAAAVDSDSSGSIESIIYKGPPPTVSNENLQDLSLYARSLAGKRVQQLAWSSSDITSKRNNSLSSTLNARPRLGPGGAGAGIGGAGGGGGGFFGTSQDVLLKRPRGFAGAAGLDGAGGDQSSTATSSGQSVRQLIDACRSVSSSSTNEQHYYDLRKSSLKLAAAYSEEQVHNLAASLANLTTIDAPLADDEDGGGGAGDIIRGVSKSSRASGSQQQQQLDGDYHSHKYRRVDDNLVKGFTAFIYNRLASGRTTDYEQNDGTYNLSYFMWFKRQTDGKSLEPNPGRRVDTAHRLEANFKSLPNVTCHNFFANLTRSLIDKSCNINLVTAPGGGGPKSGSSSSSHLSANNKNKTTSGSSSAASSPSVVPTKRLVKVYCQLRELDPRTGKNLARRELTKVREEDEDDDGDNEWDQDQDSRELGFDLTAETVINGNGLAGKMKRGRSGRGDKNEQQDFVSFMRQQRANHSNWGNANQAAGKTKKVDAKNNNSRSNRHEEDRRDNWAKVDCFELFCFHNSNLLIHKNQPTIEGQRLARRLAKLMSQFYELDADNDNE